MPKKDFVNDLSLYREARVEIKSGDLLQWRGNYPFSKVIRLGTGEEENHTSMVVRFSIMPSRVFSIEALDDGLHLYPLSKLLEEYDGSVNLYQIKDQHVGRDDEAAVAWLMHHLGTDYDWGDCLSNWRTIIGRDPDPAESSQLFCSESVFLAFRDRLFDEESSQWVGAGLPGLKGIEIAPVPGQPMLDLGIWHTEPKIILDEGMRKDGG